MGRIDHPTADVIYSHIRQTFPNISLGTVYRNLALLEEIGEIQKVSCGDNADHFDGNPHPHVHFYCMQCSKIIDVDLPFLDMMGDLLNRQFDGEVHGGNLYFYGFCPECAGKTKESMDSA
jgi:Fur family peroxide stress response transcriptional regulator